MSKQDKPILPDFVSDPNTWFIVELTPQTRRQRVLELLVNHLPYPWSDRARTFLEAKKLLPERLLWLTSKGGTGEWKVLSRISCGWDDWRGKESPKSD